MGLLPVLVIVKVTATVTWAAPPEIVTEPWLIPAGRPAGFIVTVMFPGAVPLGGVAISQLSVAPTVKLVAEPLLS
jgi:hypothetical protein